MRFRGIRISLKTIEAGDHRLPLLIMRPVKAGNPTAGVLWIHGGGYMTGMKEMALFTRALELVRQFGVTVVSPGYRRAILNPFPAALFDCHTALIWLKKNAKNLNIRPDQIMVGGESAGGGLTAALCIAARDMGSVNIACQMPLYPMLDCRDTESSRDNHGRVWNTRKNHLGWHMYLRDKIPTKYASPALETDCSGLPPCFTYVGDGEPFYCETLAYCEKLKAAGIPAECDVYHTNIHAFDMFRPGQPISITARKRFLEYFDHALRHCHAPQGETEP